MLIRNITSFRDLQNQKKLQAELLQMQIDNQNVLTQRVSDYQNPNKPPPVPPQYKTSTEIMQDSMEQQKQVIDNIRTLGADFATAAQVSQELLQLPDGTANLVKINRFFPTIQKDFEKRISRKNLDAQTIMTEFLKFFSNLDSAIGVNIRDTDSTTRFSKEPLMAKELLASKEEYGQLSNLLVAIFNTNIYNKRAIADPIMDAVDTLYANSPTEAQLKSIDTMPILERQQYNRDVEQLNKVYKLPESKSITGITRDLNTVFTAYTPDEPDTKLPMDYQIAKLQNILNRVNEKSLRALVKFNKLFGPSEDIIKTAVEKIAQPTEAQIENKQKEDYVIEYIRNETEPILNTLSLVKITQGQIDDIFNEVYDVGMDFKGNWRYNDKRALNKIIKKKIDEGYEPFIDEQKRQTLAIERGREARAQAGEQIKLRQQLKEEQQRKDEQEAVRLADSVSRRQALDNTFEIFTRGGKDGTKVASIGTTGEKNSLFAYNNTLLAPPINLTKNSTRGEVKQALARLQGLERFSGRGLTDKVLKHFNKDNREMLKLKKGFAKHLKVEKEADSESSDDSSYSGKGVRNNYAFNGRRIKLGRGVSINKDMPKYREFGKYIIHYPQLLEENVLNLKFPSTGTIPSIKPVHIDDNFKEFIIDVLDWGKVNQRHYDSLTEPEKTHFLKIARGAKVLNTLKFKTPVEDKEEEDMKRLQLLFGELNAGNDNINMVKECKVLIKKYIANGRINKNKGLEMLMEI
jgi:hypothetical protein